MYEFIQVPDIQSPVIFRLRIKQFKEILISERLAGIKDKDSKKILSQY